MPLMGSAVDDFVIMKSKVGSSEMIKLLRDCRVRFI